MPTKNEFLPHGFVREPVEKAAGAALDYPATEVGSVGNITVYYATSLGTPGRNLANGLSLGYSMPTIVRAVGATLADNYKTLTGKESAYADLKAAAQAVHVTSDNPFRPFIRPRRKTFQALNGNTAYVLGSNGNLWLETGPWGPVPPPRHQVDGNVFVPV